MNFSLRSFLLLTCTVTVCFNWSSTSLASRSTIKTTPSFSEQLSREQQPNFKQTCNGNSDRWRNLCQNWNQSNQDYSQTGNSVNKFSQIESNFTQLLVQALPSPIPPGTIEPTRSPKIPLPESLPTPAPVPQLVPTPPTLPDATPLNQPRVLVKTVEVLGNTVFSQSDLSKVVAPFIGKNLTFDQLLNIRTAITDFYTSKGYATSGAFLPSQDVSDGNIEIQVVEGQVERVDIQGLERLQNSYVRSRLKAATKTPVNIRRLEQALQLLQLDPLLQRVQAELITGTAPGSNVLLLNLKEAPPLNTALIFDNRESPSVGSEGGTAAIGYNNLLGLGDHLSTEVGITEGVTSYNLDYSIPLNARDGTLSFRYSNGRNRVVEQPFNPLEINGRAQTYALSWRQPLHRTPTNELGLGISADLRRSQTFILDDEPFSFTTGPEAGESRVSVLRFSQDWTERHPQRVLAARSQFSLGLDAFDATVNNTGTDGRFLSWLGQFQWVQALNTERDAILVFQAAAQLSGDSLLPLEQFSVGGAGTVRGYRTNQRVGDNGIFGSLEVRVPVVRDPDGFGLLQVTPFVDVGTIWSNGDEAASGTLASTGLGLRWQLGNSLSARIDWGIPLIPVAEQGDSLQDNGISFSIQWQPF